MKADGFIFDLDGTLLDSNGVWEEIDRRVLEENGVYLTENELHAAAAMTYEQVLELFYSKGIRKYTLDGLKCEFDRLAEFEYANNIGLKKGAGEYLSEIKKRGGKIALATASGEKLYKPALCRNGVYELFDAFCTTAEAGSSKDRLDIYLLAAEKIGVPPGRCAVFEDIPEGIISAKRAGMYSVAVYDSCSVSEHERMRGMADRFIMSFEELL